MHKLLVVRLNAKGGVFLFGRFFRLFSLITACVFVSFSVISANAAEEPLQNTQTAVVLASGADSSILSSSNGDMRCNVGTLAKIMTALIAAESIESGELTLDTLITASANAQSAKGAVIWLTVGEKMGAGDLLLSMMTGNANDAAIALAEYIAQTEEAFVDIMNEKAKSLGMHDTLYTDCTGLDAAAYSTANDTALLCCELVKYEFLYDCMTPWLTYIRNGETELVNSNELVKSYQGIIGIKGSKTENSQYCLAAAAERNGECYVSVCLNFADKDECRQSAKSMLNSGFSGYATIYPLIDATQLKSVGVKGGVEKQVDIDVEISPVCIPECDGENISGIAFLPKFVSAPVKKGQKLGTLMIYADDVLVSQADICAQNDVKRENIGTAFLSLLETLLN